MRTGVTGLVLVGALAGAAADDKPAPAAKGHELRVVAVGDAYHGIRFKPATGESWNLLGGRWVKLDEAAAPPAGDYDVTLVPAESLLAVRLDRATGATWLLQKGKWNPVKEPPAKPGAPAKPAGPGFALRHVVVGDQLHLVRFHTGTGAAWHVGDGAFEPLGEAGKVPAGEFDVVLIASEKEWMGFRLDRKSGATWVLRANTWREVAEP